MSRRSSPLLVEDIWEAVEKIERYVSGWITMRLWQMRRPLTRSCEISRSSERPLTACRKNFRRQYPEINWPQIIGLRHRIVHDYFNIDIEIVWHIIHTDLPVFKSRISPARER